MTVAPTILAFDTSAAYCAVAVLRDGQIVAQAQEDMARGQAERLMPMLQEVLNAAGLTFQDLSAIGVGTGPGNFTGIRVAVSAARGLALALKVPAYGVAGVDAMRLGQPQGAAVILPATRNNVYLARPDMPLELVPDVDARATPQPVVGPPDPARLVDNIARIAAARFPAVAPAPKPFYFRPADAAPAKDTPPVLLD